MASQKRNNPAHFLKRIFCLPPSTTQTAGHKEPDVPLQPQSAANAARDPIADGSPAGSSHSPKPTIEEAKAEKKKHSRAYDNLITACQGFTSLVKLIEPCLDGTPFKAPASVFIAIADAVETAKGTKGGAEDTLETLSTRLSDVSKNFAESKDEDSQFMLSEYARKLVAAAQEIDEILNSSLLHQFNVEGRRSKLESVLSRIESETNNFNIRILLAIERDTKDIRDRLFRGDLRSWNRAPAAQYKADVVENQPRRQACTEGTRVDVLKRITDWAADSSSPSIFWLSGMAGSGKSTIAYTVCRHFSESGASNVALGASFFCSRQVAELRRFGNVIPTLAYQLAHHSRSFAKALYGVDNDVVNVSGEQVEKLLLEPWERSMVTRSDVLPPLLIVIDAVDEIEDDRGGELLRELIEAVPKLAQKNTRKLKFLVTSRPHPNIKSSSESLGPDGVFRLEDVGKEQGREDIVKFLIVKLPDIALKRRDLLETLANRADGLFIYAATVVRVLFPPNSSNPLSPQERQNELVRFLDNAGAPPTSDLGAVYELYQQVLFKAIPEKQRRLRLPILHRIICTLQPLPPHALARLADVESDSDVDVDAPALLVQSLHAVLYVSESDGCVYVYHKSFSDFMLDEKLSGHELACAQNLQNAAISLACLRVMQASLHFNMCNLPSSYLLDAEVPNLAESLRTNIFDVSGLEYACRYWTSHVAKIPDADKNISRLCQQLLEFLEEKVLFWMEVTSLLKAHAIGHEGLGTVATWVDRQPNAPAELKAAFKLASHLSISFLCTPASTSTPHLYVSCLATMFGTHSDAPHSWKSRFSGVPPISCTGVSKNVNILMQISVEEGVRTIALSPDGTRIAVGSYDGLVYIWETSTGKEINKLVGHTHFVNSVAFSPDGKLIVSGSSDGSARIWSASSGVEMRKLVDSTDWVNSTAFSPDGTRVVSCSDAGSVRVWDLSTGAEIHELVGHTKYVSSVAYSPDNMRIISGSGDGTVRIWDASTGAEMHELVNHTGSVNYVAFSPDGTRLVSGSDDETARIWDASTGAEIYQLAGHMGYIQSVSFSPDGARVVCGSSSGSIHVWDALTGEELHELVEHSGSVKSVTFSPDGTRIVSGSDDNYVRIYSATTHEEMHELGFHADFVRCVAFSPDGTRVVSGSDDEAMWIWDASTGAEVHELVGHLGGVNSVAFSSNGTRIVSGSNDSTVRIWDAFTGAELQEFVGHMYSVKSVAFSPDGTHIVSGCDDGAVRIWNISTGVETHKLVGHRGHVLSVAFSPDGTRIVSGSGDHSVRVWDALTGAEIRELTGHVAWVLCVSFSVDGTQIVSCSYDGSIRIWSASTGAELRKLIGHTGPVNSVAVSSDGTSIASSSNDETVRIWDASTGVEMQRFVGHTDHIYSVAFSPDGTRIASASADKSVRIWNNHPDLPSGVYGCHLDRDTGWLAMPPRNERLLWLPFHLHARLYDGWTCGLVIPRAGSTRVDLSNAILGSDWAMCYE